MLQSLLSVLAQPLEANKPQPKVHKLTFQHLTGHKGHFLLQLKLQPDLMTKASVPITQTLPKEANFQR